MTGIEASPGFACPHCGTWHDRDHHKLCQAEAAARAANVTPAEYARHSQLWCCVGLAPDDRCPLAYQHTGVHEAALTPAARWWQLATFAAEAGVAHRLALGGAYRVRKAEPLRLTLAAVLDQVEREDVVNVTETLRRETWYLGLLVRRGGETLLGFAGPNQTLYLQLAPAEAGIPSADAAG